MTPLRLLLVDDEAPARSRLKALAGDCGATLPLTVAGEAATGKEALEWLADEEADVVLLDIRMPGISGIETARHLQALPRPPAVIFTTAYDDHALQAFEVNAIDYLLKPVRSERLLAALQKAKAWTAPQREALREAGEKPRSHLGIFERGRILLQPVADIVLLRAEQKYVTVRTEQGEHLTEESLVRLEEEFHDRFLRIHRNCLVARDRIERVEKEGEGWLVTLRGLGERLPVSRRQLAAVKEALRR
jgi:two-component system response regulator AlgR